MEHVVSQLVHDGAAETWRYLSMTSDYASKKLYDVEVDAGTQKGDSDDWVCTTLIDSSLST
eukprot:scaffold4600_cov169-Amphora_coffeaeformis.AAC.5